MSARLLVSRLTTVGLGVLVGLHALAPAAAAQTPQPAQPPQPLTLTVDEAVRRGIEHAPRLAEARARESAAESGVTALKALALPTGTAQMNYIRWNHVDEFFIPDGQGGQRVLYPDIPNVYKGRVEMQVPIFTFGRVSTSVAAARADVDVALADRHAAESDIRLEVMRVYWVLATVRENVSVLVQSLARTDAWVGDVRSRVEAGLLPPNDVQSAQAQRARQQVRLLQAQNDELVVELELARLIGVPAGTTIVATSPVDQPLPQATSLAALSVADLVKRAAGQRSELASLAARSEGLRQSAKATMATIKPYALALAAMEPSRPNPRFVPPVDAWRTSWTVDLKFVWPFFDGGRSKAQAAGLTAQATGVDARRADVEDAIAFEIRKTLLELKFGEAQIVASEEGVTAAAEARRVVGERFLAGVATSTEVLDAQVALLEAQLERSRLNAALRLCEARLLRAAGER